MSKIVDIIKGMGIAIRELTKKWDEIDDVILGIVKGFFIREKEEFENKVKAVREEVIGEFNAKLREIKSEYDEYLNDIKKELSTIQIDLSDLEEFDLNNDGIITGNELLSKSVGLLKEDSLDWITFVNKLFPVAHDELGDNFLDKSYVINWINEKADEYSFDLKKWLHLYNDYKTKLNL